PSGGSAGMKIGINRWTMPNDWSIERCFAEAKAASFDSIEINVGEEGYLTPGSTEAEVRALAEQAKRAGIEISSLSTGLGWKYPITSGDSAIRAKGAENIR